MVVWIMAPKDVYFLNPRTGEYVTLHGKKGFCRWESVKDLEMRMLSWVTQMGPLPSQGLYKREKKGLESEKEV